MSAFQTIAEKMISLSIAEQFSVYSLIHHYIILLKDKQRAKYLYILLSMKRISLRHVTSKQKTDNAHSLRHFKNRH